MGEQVPMRGECPRSLNGFELFLLPQLFNSSRRAGACCEVEQSLSTNMASVTVCFLEKTGTE